jgi:hypothetical protein
MAEQLQQPGIEIASPSVMGEPGTTNGKSRLETDAATSPGPLGEEGLIDWDVKIETPPPRVSETVQFRFVEGGPRPIRVECDVED